MSDFTDDRPKQDSLIKRPERPEKESRIDQGASDQFADDRSDTESGRDPGEQSSLTFEPAGDGNQMDLTGDRAGDDPEWKTEE